MYDLLCMDYRCFEADIPDCIDYIRWGDCCYSLAGYNCSEGGTEARFDSHYSLDCNLDSDYIPDCSLDCCFDGSWAADYKWAVGVEI